MKLSRLNQILLNHKCKYVKKEKCCKLQKGKMKTNYTFQILALLVKEYSKAIC